MFARKTPLKPELPSSIASQKVTKVFAHFFLMMDAKILPNIHVRMFRAFTTSPPAITPTGDRASGG